ncbi:MAG: hypothetical protein WBG71_11235 [Leeuwenhoekiella sp.]
MRNYQTEFLKFRLKRTLEKYPGLYMAVARNYAALRRDQSGRVLNNKSVVCIEGFPRCASSFAWHAFIKYTGLENNIATHLHSSAQIIAAVDAKIPTIVTIRHPKKCITSLQALSLQYQGDLDKPLIYPLPYDLNWYISFYESLLSIKDQIVIADFDETINNFSAILNRLNKMHGSPFQLSEQINDQELSAVILEESKDQGHLGPNENRDAIKKELSQNYDNAPFQDLKEKAEEVYREFIS